MTDRQYQKTHPWISFSIPVSSIQPTTWILLGEAQSKCIHLAGTLLDPEIAQSLHSIYLAKGALATTAIEGNTLSEEQVNSLIKGKLQVPKSKEYLKREVQNIIDACNLIINNQVSSGTTTLTIDEIKEFNRMVLRDMTLDADVHPGEIRKHSVTVGRYLGAPAQDCEILLEKLCGMLETNFSLGTGFEYATGILKAIIAHLYIAWIHPFGDGNGRTARLIEFKVCVASGIPAPAVHLLSNHYNETRGEYYRILDQTSREKTPVPFINYALQGYVDQLIEQINVIRKTQCKAFWTNYVYRVFQQKKDSQSHIRRRKLILDLSERFFDSLDTSELHFETNQWIDISRVATISARVAKLYGERGTRTIARDIKELVDERLLIKNGNKLRPNFELLHSFVPTRVSDK